MPRQLEAKLGLGPVDARCADIAVDQRIAVADRRRLSAVEIDAGQVLEDLIGVIIVETGEVEDRSPPEQVEAVAAADLIDEQLFRAEGLRDGRCVEAVVEPARFMRGRDLRIDHVVVGDVELDTRAPVDEIELRAAGLLAGDRQIGVAEAPAGGAVDEAIVDIRPVDAGSVGVGAVRDRSDLRDQRVAQARPRLDPLDQELRHALRGW
jgi:hypothetical protein